MEKMSAQAIEDMYELSPMQQGMLFESLYAPESGVYVTQFCLTLDATLNTGAFRQAWQALLDRHPSLRTLFLWEETASPLQIVRPQVMLPWQELDWRGCAADLDALHAWLSADRQQGFALEEAPLMRCTLIRTAAPGYYFVWTYHHLISDGWSLSLLLRELMTSYQAACQQQPLTLPSPRPYRDYILWLRRQDRPRAATFWQEQVQHFTMPTPLAIDRQQAERSTSGAAYKTDEYILSTSFSGALKAFAQERQLTLNTLVQGAWALLLSRYSGQQAILFGATVAGRPATLRGVEEMVGIFINTLPVAVTVPPEQPLLPWLRQLQQTQATALEYAYIPLNEIQGWSGIPRGVALFDSILVFENYPVDTSQLNAAFALVKGVESHEQTNYPLTVSIIPGQALTFAFSYDTRRFEKGNIARLAAHLQTLLHGMIDYSDATLALLPMLTADESHQLLVEWNPPPVVTPQEECVHQLFETVAQQQPAAIAVTWADEALRYAELNRLANQIAHYLQALGVEPETLVGIYLERTPLVVAALFGVLKAGAAYVPLDPAYPAARIAHMLADAQLSFLLTTADLATQLPNHSAQLVLLDAPSPVWQTAQTNLELEIPFTNLAYVIYTSGSTGQPKGVMVTHGNFVNAYRGWEASYQLHACHAHLQMASFSFDVFGGDIVRALCCGAKLVLCPRPLLLEADQLYALMRQAGVDCAEFVPAVLRHLTDYLEQTGQDLSFMRLVIAGSDAWSGQDYQRLARLCGAQTRLVNSYGITETTIDSTFFELTPPLAASSSLPEAALVPIGRPFANVQLYVLDQQRRLMPVGLGGELYIGGAGVARGYLKRPALTAERFIANPFGAGRLYKSGDLVRYLPDGNLEYLGRLDQQVKLRGFRIELGEIEAALTQHPAVQAGVVIVRAGASGEPQLVAYVVLRAAAAELRAELREYLRARLPEYMVPSHVVVLEQLPLTPNGKLDRQGLPAPEVGERRRVVEADPTQTPTEAALAAIWQGVLQVPGVGLDENFFSLGGDSILSIQVVARARQAGLHLTPRQLFQQGTIRQLAAVATLLHQALTTQTAVVGELVLTPIQREFLGQAWAEPHHYNQAVLLETVPGVNPLQLHGALTALVRHHDALRLRFRPTGEAWAATHGPADEEAALQVLDLGGLGTDQRTARLAAAADAAQASLDLGEGPLLRALYCAYGAEPGRLLLVIHHLVVDGVSWRILLEDLALAYAQLAAGTAVVLPAKSSAFQAWGAWLATQGVARLAAERAWWQGVVAQCRYPLPVDAVCPPEANTVAASAAVTSRLDAATTTALLSEAPAAYHTQINDLLLAALAQTVSQWAGQPQVAVALEGHGRELLDDEETGELDLARTVGWFTSLFPVVLTVSDPTPAALIPAIKEQLRQIPQRGIGYGVLRYLDDPTGLVPPVPLDLSFNYLGQFDATLTPQDHPLLLGLGQEASGQAESPRGRRPYLLEINALIVAGELQVVWRHSQQAHQVETVEQVAQAYLRNLRALVAHCCAVETSRYTPSDFTAVGLPQAEVDHLLATYDQNIEDIYELSPMQQGMLFESLYAPASGVYVTQFYLTLDTRLNVTAFRFAWQEVIDRHPILRTCFHWQREDTALQVVQKAVGLPWQEWDWRGRRDSATALQTWLQADRQQGFTLDQAPLMRYTLIRLSAERYAFIWTQHHLLGDGWSMPLLLQELVARYRALCAGQLTALPAPRLYRDYILWLRRQDRAQAEAFWRARLHLFTAPTPLTVDRQALTRGTSGADYIKQHYLLPSAFAAALTTFAQQNQLTVNTVVQGAWALLLGRYSGNQDVLFGATTSGRPPSLSGVEQMVGLFINTIPVAVSLPAAQPLLPWLRQLQDAQSAAQEFAYVSLLDLQSWSSIPRGVPVYESILVFENYPVDPNQLQSDVAFVEDVQSYEQTNYPLTIGVTPGNGLDFAFSYDTRRFDEATIQRMFGHLQTLLAEMMANPLRTIDQLPILTTAERQQLLVEWNQSAVTSPADDDHDRCTHQLFAMQAARLPDAVAVSFVSDAQWLAQHPTHQLTTLTYAELDLRANQLAHYLQQVGVGPDVLVGLAMERSVEMIVGLLGILKAGGAYLPLDPTYPADRLAFILADAQPAVIVTTSADQAQLPTTAQLVLLDQLTAALATQPIENPTYAPGKKAVTAQNLGYVIYTSGSTGRPKGGLLQHDGLSNLALAQIRAFGVQPAHRVLQVASLNFDASISEIMMALCAGATLVLASPAHLLPGEALARTLQQQAITHVTLVPSSLAQLAAGAFPLLQTLIIAGEACPPALAASWARHHQLFNAYGPTETTVCATIMDCTQWHTYEQGPPIGRPMANMQVYILDDNLQPVPIGVPGELYIGGRGVGRGYLNRPELTAAKFIPNPYGVGKLYKTGDLARWLPAGVIEYVGRLDHQVKIRGFRIELGEIESLLAQHPAVRECAVVAREDTPGEKRLVAYLVPAADQLAALSAQPTAQVQTDFRSYLQANLPDYMIPGVFIILPALPLTPNGKLDRTALASSDFVNPTIQAVVAPRTPVETLLCSIWREVLGVEQVSVHDNFFALGGHSLYAVMVMNRISEELGIELPLAVLFEEQTIAHLAAAIEIEQLMQSDQAGLLQALTEV